MSRRSALLLPLAFASLVAACDDGVPATPAPDVAIVPSPLTVNVGSEVAVAARFDGARPGDAAVRWTAAPDSVLSVVRTDGDVAVVAARRPGSGTLTLEVRSAAGVARRTAPVAVGQSCPASGMLMSPSQAIVAVGGTARFTATVTPCASEDRRVVYQVADTTIARVDSLGVVEGLRPGVTTVFGRLRVAPSLFAAGTVTVVQRGPVVTNITAIPNPLVLVDGDTARVRYAVALTPTSTAPRTVRFAIADTVVATVDTAGLVRAVTPGTTSLVLVADADTTVRYVVPVTVAEAWPYLSVTPSPVTVAIGGEQPLTLVLTRGPNRPPEAGAFVFETRRAAVATVTAAGVVRGVSAGTTSLVIRDAATGTAVRVLEVWVRGP
ncbi:Ig-like domain-containing protein [Roseisolibacter sp. H3M3-2]|uniref:Ig-like domain-containing protein n=1 Tax=Roseisolibacter sp. H3M3-2 TaxID=3031323 RepID=UPI0023DBA63A|nr:Ig-like domain-containing protein [Roseisolibacter sp. H3M3-2]MDF1503099.1 Ig-like domain-containing protein [Roseisolibacter sp. H3M3-2]